MLSFNQMKIYIINIYKYTAEQIWPLCLSLTGIWGEKSWFLVLDLRTWWIQITFTSKFVNCHKGDF